MSVLLRLAFLFLIQVTFTACQNESQLNEFHLHEGVTFIGLDIDGTYKSCQAMDEEVDCTDVRGDVVEYAQDCEDGGDIPVSCDCNEYICVAGKSSGEATGIDIDGNERTCEPMPLDTICTMVFTQGDQYALDCTEKGGTSFQCGCHDYICLN